jgi:hypothetical protein
MTSEMAQNLMHYLTMCFDAHLGAVLSPDMVFYTVSLLRPSTTTDSDANLQVLCELAHQIRTSPDTFRSLFTNSSQKVDLVVPTTDPAQIDFGALIEQLARKSPVDVGLFTARFSTSTEASMLAMQAAFLEAMVRTSLPSAFADFP